MQSSSTTALPNLAHNLALDHLVLAVASLEQGVRWCEGVLGVTPGAGGRHPLMGTHNRLLKLGGDRYPLAYLELIAIDPDAPPPGRARWFGLDQRAADAPPALVHWVQRCADVDARSSQLRELGCDPGQPEAASRSTPQGELRWRITLRDDGLPQHGGALPTLIQWDGVHPTVHMPASGLALHTLAIGPLPAAARSRVQIPGLGDQARPGLRAVLLTPRGPVELFSSQENLGPPQDVLAPVGGGPGAARPGGPSGSP